MNRSTKTAMQRRYNDIELKLLEDKRIAVDGTVPKDSIIRNHPISHTGHELSSLVIINGAITQRQQIIVAKNYEVYNDWINIRSDGKNSVCTY